MIGPGHQDPIHRFAREVVFSGAYPELELQAVFYGYSMGAKLPVLLTGQPGESAILYRLIRRYFGNTACQILPREERAQLSSNIAVGNGIRHPLFIGWGTLGGIFTRANDTHVYGLSNNHVIANFNNGNKGDTILHPDLGVIGTLFNWFTLLAPPQVNYMDAALVQLDPKYQAQWHPPRPATGQWMHPNVGMRVVKNGYASQTTHGVITFIGGQGSAALSGRTFNFSGIIEIQGLEGHFSDHGDSGSVVLSWPERYMVGVVFAKVGDFSWALPISRIQTLLG